jgi:hypothetical protein
MNYGIWINGSYLPSISAQFNGVNAYISAPYIPLNQRSFTVTAWINGKHFVEDSGKKDNGIVHQCQAGSTDLCLHYIVRNDVLYMGFYGDDCGGTTKLADNQWYFAAFVYNYSSNKKTVYLNSKVDNICASNPYGGTSGSTLIGLYGGSFFNGTIANVQIYSTALTPQQIQQLYLQGINSPPIPNAGLVGWWPLNGDTNDYSGWFNTGFPFNGVIFNSTKYPIPFTSASSSSAFGAGFNSFGSTNSSRTFDITIVGWSR